MSQIRPRFPQTLPHPRPHAAPPSTSPTSPASCRARHPSHRATSRPPQRAPRSCSSSSHPPAALPLHSRVLLCSTATATGFLRRAGASLVHCSNMPCSSTPPTSTTSTCRCFSSVEPPSWPPLGFSAVAPAARSGEHSPAFAQLLALMWFNVRRECWIF
jgi:hypothetical protein